MSTLFDSGIRPAIDAYLKAESEKKRDYGEYWSASSAGYCMRKVIFERMGVPPVLEDARKTRVFSSGHVFHEWAQRITKQAGISIAQELELQDEELMIRGHIDDLVWVGEKSEGCAHNNLELHSHMDPAAEAPYDGTDMNWSITCEDCDEELAEGDGYDDPNKRLAALKQEKRPEQHLILYDYKTAHSKWFEYKRTDGMSHYHHMQLGTYLYMIRKWFSPENTFLKERTGLEGKDITEGRILSISKDDLRMAEQQLMWSPELEKEVYSYWSTLNGYWKAKKLPKCTCGDFENGFLASPKYNPYWYNNEPCSIEWYELKKKEGVRSFMR